MSDDPANTSATADLYTELPYPNDGVVRTTSARILERAIDAFAPALGGLPRLHIADVGCGTGEVTVGYARRFPQAVVTGFDINPPSLRIARSLAEREGDGRVRIHRCDLTGDVRAQVEAAEVVRDGEGFDVVTSHGVLHHLPEPAVGFAAVRELVAPEGLFVGSVYSELGRWDDLAVQALLDGAALPATDFEGRADLVTALALSRRHTPVDFLRGLRDRWRFGPPLVVSELVEVRRTRSALTHLSDTFSNPCEHLYRFADLERVLTETGWLLLGLAPGGGLPVTAAEHTKDPAVVARLEALPRATMFDVFAYLYRAFMFTFVAVPAPV